MAGAKAEMGAPEGMGAQPMMVRAAALSVTGDFMLLVGMLFVLLGIASFVTDFLKVKGSGEFLRPGDAAHTQAAGHRPADGKERVIPLILNRRLH